MADAIAGSWCVRWQAVCAVAAGGWGGRYRYAYPLVAFRELIANALIHRDLDAWSAGLAIQVRLRRDRLVIANPGGLYGINVERLGRYPVTSPRNRQLVEICQHVYSAATGARAVEALASGIPPEEVGLSRGSRRRSPGLRREEVAMLCDMSIDYYSRLEQARSSQPSQQMLAAIARGLRLTLDERDHLFRLAGQNAPARTLADAHIAPGLIRLLDRLSDTPAIVMSGLGEALLQTSPARALFGDERALTGLSRIAAYRWFTNPSSRDAYPPEDHATQSGILTADLRAAYGTHGPSSVVGSVVDALLNESGEFADLWAKHDVTTPHSYEKRLQHPEVGLMTLHCQILHDHQQGQSLIVFTALPGSDSQQKLDLLAVLGSERFAPEPH